MRALLDIPSHLVFQDTPSHLLWPPQVRLPRDQGRLSLEPLFLPCGSCLLPPLLAQLVPTHRGQGLCQLQGTEPPEVCSPERVRVILRQGVFLHASSQLLEFPEKTAVG